MGTQLTLFAILTFFNDIRQIAFHFHRSLVSFDKMERRGRDICYLIIWHRVNVTDKFGGELELDGMRPGQVITIAIC